MKTTIYYFSGTGNSLYSAKYIAQKLGDAQVKSMSQLPPSETVGASDEKIGFVFPSYYGNLPRIVKDFVVNLKMSKDTYIFAVVTMGALGSPSHNVLAKLLKSKGLEISYQASIRMPANYTMMYNPGAKADEILTKADTALEKISSDILAGKLFSKKYFPLTANNLYKNIAKLDENFRSTDKCNGCGSCAKICPVGNIAMENQRPVWQHHCEHCTACINWCPQKAIEYGTATEKRTRYQNTKISIKELYYSNN